MVWWRVGASALPAAVLPQQQRLRAGLAAAPSAAALSLLPQPRLAQPGGKTGHGRRDLGTFGPGRAPPAPRPRSLVHRSSRRVIRLKRQTASGTSLGSSGIRRWWAVSRYLPQHRVLKLGLTARVHRV